MKRYRFCAVPAFVAALLMLSGCSSLKNFFSFSERNVLAGQDNVSSDIHAKVVNIVADVERIRGLKLLHPIKYYIISDDQAQKMGIEDTQRTKAFYVDNAVYLLKKNLVGDWDILAAHEFVHALQDQNFGFENIKIQDNDRDASLAVEGLIEGDAVYTMVLYAEEKGKPTVSKMIEGDTLVGRRGIFPLETALKYKFGARFVGTLKKIGGWEAVNTAFTKYPPTATFYLLHPEKYLSCQKTVSPEFVIPIGNIASVDTYGEADLLYYLLSLDPNEAAAKKAANGWTGGVVIETRSLENVTIIKWENESELNEFVKFFTEAVTKEGYQGNADYSAIELKTDIIDLTTTIIKKK